MGKGLGSFVRNKVLLVYLALGMLLVVGRLLKPYSVNLENLSSVLRWSSILGMVAIGQTVVMLGGGIDMSVGMVVFLTYILGAGLMRGQDALALPVSFLCLSLGALIGVVNGIGIAWFRIPPIVMTLGMSTVLNGVVWLYSGGVTRGEVAPAFKAFGKMSLGHYFPVSTLLWLATSIMMAFILRRTVLGRKLQAVGNNSLAAWISGVNVKSIVITSYTISGLLSAATGLMLLGYLGMANLRFTDIYTLGSITAAVIGGTTFFSGLGTIEGTIAGTFITRFIFNLLIMFRVAEAGRMIANGLILAVIVGLYSVWRRSPYE